MTYAEVYILLGKKRAAHGSREKAGRGCTSSSLVPVSVAAPRDVFRFN